MSKELKEEEIRTGLSDQESNSSEEGDDVLDDSSEEDDDEENDEEAIQKVREGFIVDDNEDDEDDAIKKRKRKYKRRRERETSNKAQDDALDEDDLELLRENTGAAPRSSQSSKFKRLKRASPDDDEQEEENDVQHRRAGLNDFFSDDDAEEAEEEQGEGQIPIEDGNILDEFENFIEEDEFSDEEEARAHKALQHRERAKSRGPKLDTSKLSSVDRESLQQLFEVFGNGAEYEWALEAQEIEDEGNNDQEPTALDEVFEHAELKERMLTEEDNMIRVIDIPERFQKYRASVNYVDLDEAELAREKLWIGNILYSEKKSSLEEFLKEPFFEAVGEVVNFVAKNNWEVPFIWTHRRDFLIYTEEVTTPEGVSKNNVHKLLFENDLWRVVQLDIEYQSLYEKRRNTERLISQLNSDDDLLRDLNSLDTMVGIQDLHDYINFTYSSELKKSIESANGGTTDGEGEEVKSAKRHSKYAIFERIRKNVLYDAVKAFGLSAKEFGENVQDQSAKNYEVPYRIHATDDPFESPEDMLGRLVEDDEILFKDPKNGLDAVRKTYAEEIFHNPKIRNEVRQVYKNFAVVDISLTDRGRSTIDNHSPYADIKYAKNRSPAALVTNPECYLKMLEAESKGLVIVNVTTHDSEHWFQSIFNCLKSDGTSEIAELWNKEREFALSLAFKRLKNMVALSTKEDLRRECERLVAAELRTRFLTKLDQAPFTPFGYDKGTKPNVLAMSFGNGEFDSAVVGVLVRDTNKISDFFKSENNPSRDRESEEKFCGQLKQFIDYNLRNQKPDVIVVSGFNPNSKRLFEIVKNFVMKNHLLANVEDHVENAEPPLIPVIWGQDETARLYQNSERAVIELSDKPTLVKYCVGLARYVQSPLLEYISLGDDILSLSFYEYQKYISNDIIKDVYETAFVDIVNMVGVEINDAIRDSYVAQLLQFVAGLGPRKASGILRNINARLGILATRSDLIENELTTANIFFNCSSFLNIPYDEGVSVRDSSIELLDATRIHPEDYSLARKMAADALDLDEEDMAHVEEQGGIIYQLMQEGVNKVDELNLTAFGKELESKFGKKKYATLQSIKEELVNNFEELRRSFHLLDSSEVFRMLTGETAESFSRGVITPVTINRVGKNNREDNAKIKFLRVSTTSKINGTVEEGHILRKANYEQGQVIQVVVLDVNYEQFTATFSALPEDIKKANTTKFTKDPNKWDFAAENADNEKELAKENAKLARTRNVQHPLFHNFNHKQAEEYLAPQSVGDCVIRPSSRALNYLTITWKVANNLFQHLSVEEISNNTGKEYVVERKRYSDLDQLIFQHVQAIAKHVNEMSHHPKFREGALGEVHEWLESYTKANPKSSAYVFCYDHKAPGWFLLLFKVNVNTPITTWHVKTEVNGFVLKGFSYPNMMRLCNGFKQTFKSLVSDKTRNVRTGYGY